MKAGAPGHPRGRRTNSALAAANESGSLGAESVGYTAIAKAFYGEPLSVHTKLKTLLKSLFVHGQRNGKAGLTRGVLILEILPPKPRKRLVSPRSRQPTEVFIKSRAICLVSLP